MSSKRGRNKNRQHTYQRQQGRPDAMRSGTHHCPECGKWCFRTRADAARDAQRLWPGTQMRYYKCPDNRPWWHYTSMSAERLADIRARQAVTDDDDPDDDSPGGTE